MFLEQIHDYVAEDTDGDSDGINSAARTVKRRRPVQSVAPSPGDNTMGLSTYQADVLFDFMVEHSANGNQEERQRVLAILEERSKATRRVVDATEENEDLKRQRIT